MAKQNPATIVFLQAALPDGSLIHSIDVSRKPLAQVGKTLFNYRNSPLAVTIVAAFPTVPFAQANDEKERAAKLAVTFEDNAREGTTWFNDLTDKIAKLEGITVFEEPVTYEASKKATIGEILTINKVAYKAQAVTPITGDNALGDSAITRVNIAAEFLAMLGVAITNTRGINLNARKLVREVDEAAVAQINNLADRLVEASPNAATVRSMTSDLVKAQPALATGLNLKLLFAHMGHRIVMVDGDDEHFTIVKGGSFDFSQNQKLAEKQTLA